ncbi:MAG: tRNA pseudouridine(55) synthase TruB [Victivallales bacterium]|nr:tRNA pseudouridine(55) synthase TruB [Victivallales bacterium]
MVNSRTGKDFFYDSGILLVDKPSGWTSHDVVNLIRKRFKAKKVGHCGTLDPAATGLLVIVIGKATKLSQRLSGQDKTYRATILLGKETDSMDLDGDVISESEDWKRLNPSEVRLAILNFKGNQLQIPPMVSAKKINGKKLYELARKGKTVKRDPVPIVINSLTIENIELPTASFTVNCSKGTYIRVLSSEIGKKLGCGAVLKKLRRIECGTSKIEDSYSIETIKSWEQCDLSRNLIWSHNITM